MKMDISTDDLWEELYKELTPDIPFDKAKTIKMALEEINEGKEEREKVTEGHVRDILDRKVDKEGWKKAKFKIACYYWPPE